MQFPNTGAISQLSFASQGVIDIADTYFDDNSERDYVISDRQKSEIIEQMAYRTIYDLIDTDKSLFSISNPSRSELSQSLKVDAIKTIGRLRKILIREKGKDSSEVEDITNLILELDNTWEGIMDKYQERMASFSITFDENDKLVLEDENNSGKETYQDATKVDSFKKASPAIKLLLSTIPVVKLNTKGEVVPVPSSIGGIKLVPMGKTYISIMNRVHKAVGIEQMFSELRDMAEKDPTYRLLYKRITKSNWIEPTVDFSKINSTHSLQLLSAFWRTFKKQNPIVKNVFILENGEVVIGDGHLSAAANQLQDQFRQQLIVAAKKGQAIISIIRSIKHM